MKKLVAAFLCMAMLLTTACGTASSTASESTKPESTSASSEPEVPKEKDPITIQFWYAAAEGDENDLVYRFNKENVELFEKANPHVTIETFIIGGNGGEDYKVKLNAEALAEKLPDVFMTWHGPQTAPLVENDLVMSIDQLIADDAVLSEIVDYGTLGMCTYDGVVYGLPDTVDAIGYFYNKKIYKDLGLEVPTTYEQMLEDSKVMIENGITPIALGNATPWVGPAAWTMMFMQKYGYDRYTEELLTGSYDFGSEDYVATMVESKEMVDAGMYGDNFNSIKVADAKAAFLDGKAATFLMGSWAIGQMLDGLGDDLGFMTLPSKDGNAEAYMIGASKGYALSKDASPEAIDFFKFIYSKERQAAYAEMGVLVSTKNIGTDATKIPAIMSEIAEKLNTSTSTYITWGDLLDPSVKRELEASVQSIYEGADAQELLQLVQDVAVLES